jgi:hypothetical protein
MPGLKKGRSEAMKTYWRRVRGTSSQFGISTGASRRIVGAKMRGMEQTMGQHQNGRPYRYIGQLEDGRAVTIFSDRYLTDSQVKKKTIDAITDQPENYRPDDPDFTLTHDELTRRKVKVIGRYYDVGVLLDEAEGA